MPLPGYALCQEDFLGTQHVLPPFVISAHHSLGMHVLQSSFQVLPSNLSGESCLLQNIPKLNKIPNWLDQKQIQFQVIVVSASQKNKIPR